MELNNRYNNLNMKRQSNRPLVLLAQNVQGASRQLRNPMRLAFGSVQNNEKLIKPALGSHRVSGKKINL